MPALADRFHLVAPDYPGFGNTDMPDPATFPYAFDRLSQITEGLLLALGFDRFARLPGVQAKLAFAARKLVPPPAWMRSCVPLARRGRLGLAAAYLWRPISLVARLGPGWRAWRRAVKKTR